MNSHREYFLRHLAIGEQWILRKSELPLETADSGLPADSNAGSSLAKMINGDGVEGLREAISSCHQCTLCSSSGKLVQSDQIFNAEILVIYDWSEQENFDVQLGADFKKLLVNILKSMAVEPGRIASLSLLNANFPVSSLSIPSAASADFCGDFLRRAVALGKAKKLLVLGARAANALLENTLDIEQLRSSLLNFAGVPVVVTYSPYDLLAGPSLKRVVWRDICQFHSAIIS